MSSPVYQAFTVEDVFVLERELRLGSSIRLRPKYNTPWELLHELGHWAIYPRMLRERTLELGGAIPMHIFGDAVYPCSFEEDLVKTWTSLMLQHKNWYDCNSLEASEVMGRFPKAASPTRPDTWRERELKLLGIDFSEGRFGLLGNLSFSNLVEQLITTQANSAPLHSRIPVTPLKALPCKALDSNATPLECSKTVGLPLPHICG